MLVPACSLSVAQFWKACCVHFIMGQHILCDTLLPYAIFLAPDFSGSTPKLPTCTLVCLGLCSGGSLYQDSYLEHLTYLYLSFLICVMGVCASLTGTLQDP